MEDKSLELLTPEQRKLHEEFVNCKTQEDVDRVIEKTRILSESLSEPETYLDMTLEEFDNKYHLAKYEDVKEKMGL